ncbi:MAG: FG-GAP repeat domain-containing protein, partial [Planctomycetota bacterium]
DADVLSASYDDDKIAWYENQGGGVFGTQQVITTSAYGAQSVYATDLDGDGDADVLSASAIDNKIAWYENFLAAPDCNGNGTPDQADINSGTSLDCNSNGIPDECELASGAELDCNANGVPDSCDIAAGLEFDCDANGIPDACQIASDSTLDLNANGTLDACEAIGTTYCAPAVANSTGLPGVVTILGNETVLLNDLKVSARQLPASAFGYFIASTTPGSVFPVSNSVGTLCVIGSIGPGVGGGTVNSGPDGFFYGSVDLNAMPQPVGTVMVQPGDTWHFQAWHRDAIGGQTTSNFTDAVAVTFQ